MAQGRAACSGETSTNFSTVSAFQHYIIKSVLKNRTVVGEQQRRTEFEEPRSVLKGTGIFFSYLREKII